jgi:ABC-2 type transport system ATP-binding protein
VSVGVGFHPELTGRENVYVNATILGLSRREIDRRLDEIVSFAEIGPFLDTPVKFYSSGMFVRLGFSVAVAADPDVLLVDEVLAVGDAPFQAKCFERMRALHAAGATLVVVSHNLDAIRLLCPRTVVLADGEVSYDGPTGPALDHYLDLLRQGDEPVLGRPDPTTEVLVADVATVESLRLFGEDGTETTVVRSGERVVFETIVSFRAEVDDPLFGIGITTPEGVLVYSDSSAFAPTGRFRPGDRVRWRCRLCAALGEGRYVASTGLRGRGLLDVYDRSAPLEFACVGGGRGLVDLTPDSPRTAAGRVRA